MMRLVEELPPGDGICILGAGSCDEIDLSALLVRFTTVHLVDSDTEALARAETKVPEAERGRVLRTEIELTGLLDEIPSWSENEQSFQDLVEGAPARVARKIDRTFDVVLSNGVMRRLCAPLEKARTSIDPVTLSRAVARIHFRTLALLTRPLGRAVIVNDAVYGAERSSPARPPTPPAWDTLDRAAVQAIQGGAPLSNPEYLLAALQEPLLAELFERPTLTAPWLRTVGEETRLAYGIMLRATGALAQSSARTALSPRDPALFDLQTGNNRETAGFWDFYAEHRQRVTSLIASQADGGRVVVLGAGNSNAHDLEALTAHFSEVHLVDLDQVALARAKHRQSATARAKLVLHAPIDLGGVLERLPAWAGLPPAAEELAKLPETAAANACAALPGPFDVVVSEGLLTQLFWTCFKALGSGPVMRNVLPAVLVAHLRTMTSLAKPGGACLLVTDTAATEGLPLDDLRSEPRALALLEELDRQGKLFTGTNPALVTAALRSGWLAQSVDTVRVSPPWVWRFLKERTTLVYALAFRRRDTTSST
jgi:hypothetical protein